MNKLLFNLIVTLQLVNSYSQSLDKVQNSNKKPNTILITNSNLPNEILRSRLKIIEAYEGIEGSPYIKNSKSFKHNIPIGKVYDATMNLMGTAFILYNAYTDEMEISAIDDSVNFYRIKKQSNSFYIKLKEKLYRAYVIDYNINYFIIVSDSDNEKCSLLKKEKIIFIKGTKQNVSLVKGESSSFIRVKDSYYLKLNESIYKIPSNKKNFFALFNEKADIIKTYVKQNKLKISSEKNLLAIVNYYNSLT